MKPNSLTTKNAWQTLAPAPVVTQLTGQRRLLALTGMSLLLIISLVVFFNILVLCSAGLLSWWTVDTAWSHRQEWAQRRRGQAALRRWSAEPSNIHWVTYHERPHRPKQELNYPAFAVCATDQTEQHMVTIQLVEYANWSGRIRSRILDETSFAADQVVDATDRATEWQVEAAQREAASADHHHQQQAAVARAEQHATDTQAELSSTLDAVRSALRR